MAKKITIQLPEGIAVYPKLNTVDVYQPLDKKGKPNGPEKRRYITDIKYDDVTLAKVMEIFKTIAKKHCPDSDNPKLPIKKNKKTGEITVTMASGEKYRPAIFDANNEPVPPSVNIGGGSILKPFVTVNPYDGFGGGLNLYMNSLQLIRLEQNQFTSPFEKVDGGYSYKGDAGSDDGEDRDHNSDDDDGEESYTF